MWSKIKRYNTEIPEYINTKRISKKVKNMGNLENNISINSLWYRDEKGYIVRSQSDKQVISQVKKSKEKEKTRR